MNICTWWGYIILFVKLDGDHRDLHVLTHSFPTRRSSDLGRRAPRAPRGRRRRRRQAPRRPPSRPARSARRCRHDPFRSRASRSPPRRGGGVRASPPAPPWDCHTRSEEHTSELQSLMRISYAVFCLKKKKKNKKHRL